MGQLKCKQPWTRWLCFPSHKHTHPPHTLALSADRGSPETAACLVVGFPTSLSSLTLPPEGMESVGTPGSLADVLCEEALVASIGSPRREALGQAEPARTKWRALPVGPPASGDQLMSELDRKSS